MPPRHANPSGVSDSANPLIAAAARLRDRVDVLQFGEPVSYVYNPLRYAWAPHEEYLRRFGASQKRVIFLGMNPGPWGMAQVGVPFGEVGFVRDWMGIHGEILKPEREHPKRPVEGFSCTRSEVSGRRLWGLFSERFGTAEAFFKDHLVLNFCPLVWMGPTGANLTPDKLTAAAMAPVEEACTEHLVEALKILQPQHLIGIGAFAAERLRRVQTLGGISGQVGQILHPSPASPAANRGWAAAATGQLKAQGVWE